MGQKLSKAPVYFTIAQVQFNPILDLIAFLPAIQGKMRTNHFPDFRQNLIQQVAFSFSSDSDAQMPPVVTPNSRYIFGNINGTSHFLLEKNSLSFQTTEYGTFDVFLNDFVSGINIIHEIINLDFIERVGIRYLDAVQPIQGKDRLQDYLVTEVLGLSKHGIGKFVQSVSETISDCESGQLISRVIMRRGYIGLPEELSALTPTIAKRFLQYNGEHAILDNDAFLIKRDVFSVEQLRTTLSSLHTEISKSFKATITEHAKDAWK